jgi:D-aminopeptidase
MLVAASAARFDIPLVLVTGDDVLQKEIAAFSPKTEYVVVKRAVSVEQAEARPQADVNRDIEAAAERAFRARKSIPPWRPAELRGDFENRYSYVLPDMAAIAINFPGAEAVDNKTVRVRTRSFLDAYFAFRALANFTGLATQRMLVNFVRDEADGRSILQKAQQRLPSRAQRTFAPTGDTIPRGYGRHGYR